MSTTNGRRPSAEQRRTLVQAALGEVVDRSCAVPLTRDLGRVCRGAASLLGVRGAVLTLVPGSSAAMGSSDEFCARLGRIAAVLGEGPGIDALALRRPVLMPRLLEEGPQRWPAFASVVRRAGVQAWFSFPLHAGPGRLGVLDLISECAQPLSAEAVALAEVFGDVAAELALEHSLAAGSPGGLDIDLLDALHRRSQVHLAQGMVMVAEDVDPEAALALLRARAFSRDISVVSLAREILAGQALTPEE